MTDTIKKAPFPMIQGRFNYFSYKANLYNILFVPFRGTSCIIVARNLDKDLAFDLVDALNEALDEARKELEVEENEDDG